MNREQTEFPLVLSPQFAQAVRMLAVASGASLITCVALYLTNMLDPENAFYIGAFLTLGFASLAVNFWLQGRGVAVVSSEYLEVRTRAGKSTYAWRDISEFLVRTESDGSKFVEMQLSAPEVVGYLPGQAGTRAWGIPIPFLRTNRLYVTNPEAFVDAATLLVKGQTRATRHPDPP